MSNTNNSNSNQCGPSWLCTFLKALPGKLRCRQSNAPRNVPAVDGCWLEKRVPSSPRIRGVLITSVGGVLSAIAGAAMAASPAVWVGLGPDTLTLLQLSFVGAVIGLGQGMAADPPLTIGQTIGRALQSTGVALSAGITVHLVPDASPILIIAAGALLASVGTDALKDLWGRFIERKPHGSH